MFHIVTRLWQDNLAPDAAVLLAQRSSVCLVLASDACVPLITALQHRSIAPHAARPLRHALRDCSAWIKLNSARAPITQSLHQDLCQRLRPEGFDVLDQSGLIDGPSTACTRLIISIATQYA